MLGHRYGVVMLSAVCQGQAIPLLWQTLEQPSADLNAELVVALLRPLRCAVALCRCVVPLRCAAVLCRCVVHCGTWH